MSPEKDAELCKKYPKIFKDRYSDMTTTAMCWGFECDDGWFNIIDKLCANIQSRIDWIRQQRVHNLKYNRALKAAIAGDKSKLILIHSPSGDPSSYAMQRVEEDIQSANFRTVAPKVQQVVAIQVKEKFGGLRFYYEGGDSHIHGMSQMAESLSYVTCEVCGSPGKPNSDGWIKTLCDAHKREKD